MISENSTEGYIIIDMERSVIHNLQSAWAIISQCGERTIEEGCQAFAVITSCRYIETVVEMKPEMVGIKEEWGFCCDHK